MRHPLTLSFAALVLLALVVPAFAAPPAMADAFPPQPLPSASPSDSGNNTTGGNSTGGGNGGGNNTTTVPPSPLSVTLSGPLVLVAGGNATWDVWVRWNGSLSGNNTTTGAPSHHVTLTATLVGTNGTVVLDPASVDVQEGGASYARATVTVPLGAAPGPASLVVDATASTASAEARATFAVV